MILTKIEEVWLNIIRFNKGEKKEEITKKVEILGISITYNCRSKNNLWGRFGGGWNWELGIQIGSDSIILNCLVFSLWFQKIKEKN